MLLLPLENYKNYSHLKGQTKIGLKLGLANESLFVHPCHVQKLNVSYSIATTTKIQDFQE
jgi:hypothetical protein